MKFNDTSSALNLLLTRRSGKARDMVDPGPSAEQLQQILVCGMRVPDHGKIAPWRFMVVGKPAQETLGEQFAQAYVDDKPDASKLEIEAISTFPAQAPVMIAVLSRIDRERAIPEWEQILSAGAACQNLVIAAHAMGFCANWLTGWCAYSPTVVKLLGGEDGDRIAGFLFIGTSGKDLQERPRPESDTVIRYYAPN